MAGPYGFGKGSLFGSPGGGLPNDGEVLYWDGTALKAMGSSFIYASDQLKAPDGSVSAPSYSFVSDTDTGFYYNSANVVAVSIAGSNRFVWNSNSAYLSNNAGYFGWGSGVDVRLYRDAAATLALRNGANAQTFNIYNTYTDGSNYEQGQLKWNGNSLTLETNALGTGTARPIFINPENSGSLGTADTARYKWDSVAFYPQANNTYALGVDGLAWSSIYWGTQALAPDGSVGAPSYSFASDTDTGIRLETTGDLRLVSGGVDRVRVLGTSFILDSGQLLAWGSSGVSTADVKLYRDAANTLALRNSTNNQEFRVYGTYTDASNYSRLALSGVGDHIYAIAEKAGSPTSPRLYLGTGSGGSHIYLRTGGSTRWIFEGGGSYFSPTNTNSCNLGNNTLRWKNLYIAGDAYLNGNIYWDTQALAPDGSAAAPSYSFSNDSDTGMRLGGTNTIQFIASGSSQWNINTGALFPPGSNLKDIGGAGYEVKNIYVGTKVLTPEIEDATEITIDAPTTTFTGDVVYEDTFWDDMLVEIISTRVGGSTYLPTWTQFMDDGAGSRGVYAYLFGSSTENEAFFEMQLSHRYKEGTDIECHAHWSSDGTDTGNVKFFVEYTVKEINGTFPNTSTISGTDAGSGTAKDHQICEIGTIDGTNFGISTVLVGRVYRDPDDAGDTLTDGAFLHYLDFHFQVDAPGSDDEYVK